VDFSNNRAEHDDILGDACEYLMRHFASESGKSKGQFYTPSEVSRIMARVIGIGPANAKASTTAYDPTCGPGSLLLKVAAEAGKHITLEGQEKDVTTAGLARMNMILHDFPTANILSGNTLFDPKFKDGEKLRTYDYVVANPPFSDKTWSTGLTLGEGGSGDRFQRFAWGVPPKKQQRFHEGRSKEPPPRAGPPQDCRHLHPAGLNRPALRPHGSRRGNRRPKERLQPQPPALH
jgi:type I restriction enzyme M protein